MSRSPKQPYRSDLDGLRALAVLAVLFYHAQLGFSGGYVGVDIFFVLSGYLITGQLIRTCSQGTFTFVDFWERRVRRLVPALTAVVFLTGLIAPVWLLPEDLKDLGGTIFSQPLLMVNVYYWKAVKGGYFGDLPENRPLLHLWSLGIEEQFYVVFPVLVYLVLRYSRLDRLRWILGIVTLASFVPCAMLTKSHQIFSFFMLPTRAWELLIGGILASAPSLSLSKATKDVIGMAGIGALIALFFMFDEDTTFPGTAAMLPCLATALIILSGPNSIVSNFFSAKPLRTIGLSSYSTYLWHWPFFSVGFYMGALDHPANRWGVLLASCIAGHLSWQYIEEPIRRRRFLPHGKHMGVLFFGYLGFSLILGGYFFLSDGLAKRYSDYRQHPAPNLKYRHEVSLDQPVPEVLGVAKEGSIKFILWGDSHAMAVAPAFDQLSREYGVTGLMITRSSTPPLKYWSNEGRGRKTSMEDQEKWWNFLLETVRREKPSAVFLSGFWSGSLQRRPSFRQELRDTVASLGGEEKVQVYIIADVPRQHQAAVRRHALATRWSISSPMTTPLEHSHDTQRARLVFEELQKEGRCIVVDPSSVVLRWSSLLDHGIPLYRDTHHLTETGGLLLAPVFEPVICELARQ